MNKRVKIVATLGPAVEIRGGKKFGEDGYWGEKLDREASAKNIAQLIKEGANVFRFNFSHGDHAEQGERMDVARRSEVSPASFILAANSSAPITPSASTITW